MDQFAPAPGTRVSGVSPVIALTGPFGAGLTTAANRMQSQHGYQNVSVSAGLRNEWAGRYENQLPARSDLQRLGDELRQEGGPGALVDHALSQADLDAGGPIVIESIKNVGEITVLRRLFGYRLLLVAILSDIDVRIQRLIPLYDELGLDPSHVKDDDLRDRNEEVPYGQEVELCIDLADIILLNNDSMQDFLTKIDDLVGLADRSKTRDLTETEIYMHSAYSMARGSKCLKRHVGAVLVDSLGRVVAAGYNENPSGTKPCAEEVLYNFRCHRDIVRNEHFASLARRGARCPVCNSPIARIEGPPWRCPRCYQQGRKTNLEVYFFPDRAMNWCTAVHAEVRAILAAGDRARGAVLYTTTFPCMQCAEKITEAGVAGVVYTEAYPDLYGSARMRIANINVRQFEGVRSSAVDRLFPNPWQPLS
jgi:deoxycytidylate deaminase/dephospho-CoA kinase